MKLNNLLLIAGAGIAGFFLFSAFKNKTPGTALPGGANKPIIRTGIESLFQSNKKGITNRETTLYDRHTKEAKAVIQENVTLSLIGQVATDKGACYVHQQGYILMSHITITDEGQGANTQ